MAYSAYASTLKYVVNLEDEIVTVPAENLTGQQTIGERLRLNGFADDHSVNDDFNLKKEGDEDRCHNPVQDVMVDINQWMCGNCLKMNPSKTEFIYFGSHQMLAKCIHDDMNVCGDIVKRSGIIKLLGTLLDSNLNFKKTHYFQE